MATKTLTIKSTIDVPAELIYRAFTNATALREWFCDGAMVQSRVGGRLYCQWHDGIALMGQYTALTPDKKVAFTLRSDDPGDYTTCTITIVEKAGSSVITLTDSSDSKDRAKISAAVEANWNSALENLKSVLETGVDQRLARRPMLGLDGFEPKAGDEGVRIGGTLEGSGAREAGLQKDDVILSVGSRKTQAEVDIPVALNGHKAGDKVKISYRRNGKVLNAVVTLSPRAMPEIPDTAERLAEIVARKYTDVNRDLTQAFKGISDERAARRPGPGQWSALHVLAHLIEGERNLHNWIKCLIAGQEPWQDEWEGNLQIRVDSIINGFPTIQALLTELKRNEAETVAMLNALPDSFVARKGSYHRMAHTMLTWPDHTREHLDQIRSAVRN
jgi:uncharacterized protein YndB with AHSA1/START domain